MDSGAEMTGLGAPDLDANALAWLKSQGKGYQSRMNAILRDAMLNAK